MSEWIIGHRIRGHRIVNTGVCDTFGTVMKFCEKCRCSWHITEYGYVTYYPEESR